MAEAADLDQFTDLVREYQASLRAFIRMLGVDAEWVDDFAQETFLVAYRDFRSFDARKGPFPKGLRGIARNLVANEARKSARHARIENTWLPAALARDPEPEAPALDPDRAAAALKDCIGALSPENRRLLERRYGEETNASDLARQLGRSPVAVRQSLMRLRAAVRRCIEGKAGEARA